MIGCRRVRQHRDVGAVRRHDPSRNPRPVLARAEAGHRVVLDAIVPAVPQVHPALRRGQQREAFLLEQLVHLQRQVHLLVVPAVQVRLEPPAEGGLLVVHARRHREGLHSGRPRRLLPHLEHQLAPERHHVRHGVDEAVEPKVITVRQRLLLLVAPRRETVHVLTRAQLAALRREGVEGVGGAGLHHSRANVHGLVLLLPDVLVDEEDEKRGEEEHKRRADAGTEDLAERPLGKQKILQQERENLVKIQLESGLLGGGVVGAGGRSGQSTWRSGSARVGHWRGGRHRAGRGPHVCHFTDDHNLFKR
mmetsp:Transcript_17370/g.43226  ORF Transcript_17370/g.43226 Transcript_17370/m.43226 type:complete len:306 (+) Transcript_17370:4335-5252(+)